MRTSIRVSTFKPRGAYAWLAAVLATALPLSSVAQTGPVCWNRTMELVDRTMTPPEGGDNAFFTRAGGAPPAGLMIFANTPSMMQLAGFDPASLPTSERGCAKSSFLNSRTWKSPNPLYAYSTTTSSATSCSTTIATPAQNGRVYDPNFTYPRIDDGCYMEKSYKTTDDFDPTKFYRYLQWDDDGTGTGMTASTACNALSSSTDRDSCNTCFADASKPGYFIPVNNPSQTIFRGNFLHFYGPVYMGALGAWKGTIAGNARIRWGHGFYDNNLPGIDKGRDPNPECNKFDTDFNTANRGSYINAFSNKPPPFGTITKFPLAQAIFSMGYFLSGSGTFTGATSSHVRSVWEPMTGKNQDTICAACQFNATIVITDGSVSDDTALPTAITNMDVATPGDYANRGGLCSSNSDCGDSLKCVLGFCIDRKGLPCSTATECGPNYQCVQGSSTKTCQDKWYADDVAAYFQTKDVRKGACGNYSCDPNVQTMATYVINVGAKNNRALRNVAVKGAGMYIEAATASEIRDAMTDIVNDIIKRSTSYSVASVTSVQTKTTTALFVPRFKPSVQTNWEGHLYRFKLFNENAAGCTSPADTQPLNGATSLNADQLSRNPNGNSTCSDIYYMDGNNKFVGENSEGDFMVLDRNFQPTAEPAVPVWDAAARLVTNGPASRNIQTYIDANENGQVNDGEQFAFTTANVNTLLPALALGGVTGTFCTNLGAALGLTYATETECATDLIRWVRGEDIFDEDGDNQTTDSRAVMLGDIFHSSPNLVVPPLPRQQIVMGINPAQSVASLFATNTPSTDSTGTPTYDTFVSNNATRTRFILVGSNSGMLHAFHAGDYHSGDDPETATVEPSSWVYYDAGTGNEMWAFIPPEMLPKLKNMLMGDTHQEYVDASPMVRDVWVDLNQDGSKTADEYKTVAVTGMRRGGRTYFGLDVTNPTSPKYLWSNPKTGTADYLMAGQSWNDIAPRAPPIVPMFVKAVSPYRSSFTYKGVPTREQWVIWLGGGYDPTGLRGRSINAYDIWTGKQVFRAAGWQATGTTDPRASMGPVPSALAFTNFGDPTSASAGKEAIFDTGTVGDTFGNVWTIRATLPGEDTDGDGIYDNWYIGRSFETNKGTALAGKMPFFQAPAFAAFITNTSASLRAYMGTGDRANIRDLQGGVCSLNNIGACIRKGCTVDVQLTKQNIGTSWTSSGRLNLSGKSTTVTNNSVAASGTAAPICSANVDAAYSVRIDCSAANLASGATAPAAQTFTYALACANGIEPCATNTPRPSLETSSFAFNGPTTLNRFYAIPVFGGTNRTDILTASQASTYDGARLTETDLANPGNTAASATTSTISTLEGPRLGWYVNLGGAVTANPQDERSADIPVVQPPYVFWQTFTPGVITNTTDVCSRQANDTAAFYHADLISGGTAADSGLNTSNSGAFVPRFTTGSAITPPKSLIEQKVVTPSGQVVSTLLSIEPGRTNPLSIETGRTDLYVPIQVLEIDRKTHECRHVPGKSCD